MKENNDNKTEEIEAINPKAIGGMARAESLSPEKRSDIARQAAQTRWDVKKKLPKEEYSGILKIGDMEIPCAVLNNGMRVLSERGVIKALGGKRGGAHWRRKKADPIGANLPVYASANNLKPYIDSDLLLALTEPLLFVTKEGGAKANGLDGALLPKVCDIWLKARQSNALHPSQEHIAKKAEVLIRGFAHVGIIALIDEATGFQDDRAKNALAKILEEFIAKELRPYVKTFPMDFYKEMFRLRKWKWPDLPSDQRKRPVLVGRLTDNIVYDRLAPGVKKRLKDLIGRNEAGKLKHKMFQRLTEQIGDPKLREHLASVVALMKAADTWDDFMRMIDRSLPKYKYLPLFDPKID